MNERVELGRKKIADIESSDFIDIYKITQVLSSDNIIEIPLDVEKVIEVFEEKILKKVMEDKKYSEEFIQIIEEDLECAYEEIIEELQEIFEYKCTEIDAKVFIEYYTRNPLTLVEKMEFQAVIDNIIKEYARNYIEELSDLLVTSWLIIEERAYKDMKESGLDNES